MKRGLYGKIDFWNRLMDVPIGDPDAPLLLTGYEPDVLREILNINLVVLWEQQLTIKRTRML